MNSWRKFLFNASRSRGFLWRFAIGMLLAGALAGYGLARMHPPRPERFVDRVFAAVSPQGPDMGVAFAPGNFTSVLPAFEHEVRDPSVEFVHVIEAIPTLASWLSSRDVRERVRAILKDRFNAAEADVAVDFLEASATDDREAKARLEADANGPAPSRFAGYALGSIEMERNKFAVASAWFQKAGRRPEAVESRRMAVHALLAAEDFETLSKLRDDPLYAKVISPHDSLQIAIAQRDWREIIARVPAAQLASFDSGTLVIAIIAALAWAFVLAHLGEAPGFFSTSTLLWAAAFVCGVLSTTPTVCLVILQDEMLHFSPEGDVLRNFAYFIGGVGVREELCKLLLFVPLIPFLRRRDDELEVLIVASFVGLGFAFEENGSYLLSSHGLGIAGRFLTANFFHIALTGVNGLALYRACRRGLGGLNEFLYVFAITVIAHGLYDALSNMPAAGVGSYLAMTVFVLFSALYFDRAHDLRSNARMTISLSGAFVFGVAILAATVIAYQMMTLGPALGAKVVFPELIGSGVLLIMFFREFDEQLAV